MGIEKALADCLKRIESGELTREEALRSYPALREELEPLLALVAEMRSMPRVVAPQSLRSYKRPVFQTVTPGEPAWKRWLGALTAPSFGWAAPLARAAAALVVVMLLGGGTMVASANSLPEEPLYPVKLALENAQLALVGNPEARAELELQLATRRLQEVEKAAKEGKTGSVQRGLALYEERLESALKFSEARSPAVEDSQTEQIEESLQHNYQVLEEVQSRVENPQAKAALQRAMERTEERTQAAKGKAAGDDKKEDKKNPKSAPAAGASVTPSPTQPSAAPTGTSAPAGGREVPEKAKPHSEAPGSGGREGKPEDSPLKAQGSEEGGQGPEARGQRIGLQLGTSTPSTPSTSATGTPTVEATVGAVAGATATQTASTSSQPQPTQEVEKEQGRDREKPEKDEKDEKDHQPARDPEPKRTGPPPREGESGVASSVEAFLQNLLKTASSLSPGSGRR